MADRIKNYQQEADQITTLKAIRTDLGVTPSSYTPDATVVTKDRVVTFAQAEEELVVLSDIEKGVKQQIVDVDIAQKDISNIKSLLQGHLYDYQTDSTSAYTKSVPAGALPYAGLEKVGGKTIVYNQLCTFSTQTQTKNGITWTKNADNSYTANGDSGNLASDLPLTPTLNLPTGHKILIKGCPTGGSDPGYFMRNGYGGERDTGNGVIITIGSDTRFMLQANVWAASVSNVTFHPLAVDLTLMFGAGNEPTIEQFNALFPASYYPYNEGTLLSAGVTEVVSKDSNNATLQTYSIPASIQALEGYGWSCPDHYNYIDYEAKKYVQEVGSRAYASGDESDSTVITDGTTTYYPLNPAIETDISAYLTDDNLVNVESGGTLTFLNQNGDDYQIPVPSDETYMIDLQEAINNG